VYSLPVNSGSLAEFTEVESGKPDDRPELANALAACKAQGQTDCCQTGQVEPQRRVHGRADEQ